MISNIVIFFLFVSLALVEAAPTDEENVNYDKIIQAGKVLIIIGIILGGFALLILAIVAVSLLLKYVSKKMSEPQYFVDDTTSEKYIPEFVDENNPNQCQYTQEPNILSVPYMVTSVKQSLVDLGHSLKPSNYDRAQRNYQQKTIIVDDKQELRI